MSTNEKPVWKPLIHLEASRGSPHLNALRENLAEIDANVDFVLKELPTLPLASAEAERIKEVFEEFSSCCYDIRTEIRNLTDELGLGDPSRPWDPGIVNPDPRVTMGFIKNWLYRRFDTLDALVKKVGAEQSRAFILVAESAVNMLHAYASMNAALEQIEAAIAPLLAAARAAPMTQRQRES